VQYLYVANELKKLPMNKRRINLGFDLRVNPELQSDDASQMDQYLVPALRNPISVDAAVWREPEAIENLTEGILPDFANPLHLAKSLDRLLEVCEQKRISTAGLWRVCITTLQTNLIALNTRFGPGSFEEQTEEQLRGSGWELVGFDVADLGGLVSGLKGCGYVEPSWSQLRDAFASYLNTVGLFDDYAIAAEFAEVRGLQIREHAPFAVLGVLTRQDTTAK
jgi:hypothetical protein